MNVADEPAAYDVVSTDVVYRSRRVIDVRRDEVAMPGGTTAQRDVVEHPGAVGVIAMDEQQRVLLLRQYRHPVRQLLWEPPAGLLDEPGEDPLDTAKRELFEEAHLRAERWDVLVDAFTSPGMTSEAVRIYLAREVRPAEEPRHVGEHEEADMPIEWVDLQRATDLVVGGALHNPLAVMGILAAATSARTGFAGLRPGASPWPQMGGFRGSATRASAD